MKEEEERARSAAHFGVHAQGATLPEPAPDPTAKHPDQAQQGNLAPSGASQPKAPSPYAVPPLRLGPKPPMREIGTAGAETEGLGLAFNSDKGMDGAFRSPRPTPPPSREQKHRAGASLAHVTPSAEMRSSMAQLEHAPTTLSEACAGLEVRMRCFCQCCSNSAESKKH